MKFLVNFNDSLLGLLPFLNFLSRSKAVCKFMVLSSSYRTILHFIVKLDSLFKSSTHSLNVNFFCNAILLRKI